MTNKDKFSIGNLKELAQKGIATIDVEEIKNKTNRNYHDVFPSAEICRREETIQKGVAIVRT